MNLYRFQMQRDAFVNLRRAQAEIEPTFNYDSILRARHYVEMAERCLGFLAEDMAPKDEGAEMALPCIDPSP
jgi:hypothetical protein